MLPPRAFAQLARTPLNNMPEVIRRVTGGAIITRGRVKLNVPPLVENGHLVPLGVTVESPMTASDFVREIHVFTEKNPLPEMISFYLGPRAGRASIATRVRLAGSQRVMAVAEMSDGTFWVGSRDIVVTHSACVDES